jgi:hypothetical protein
MVLAFSGVLVLEALALLLFDLFDGMMEAQKKDLMDQWWSISSLEGLLDWLTLRQSVQSNWLTSEELIGLNRWPCQLDSNLFLELCVKLEREGFWLGIVKWSFDRSKTITTMTAMETSGS